MALRPCALWCIFVVGCANPTGAKISNRDFSVLELPDMAAGPMPQDFGEVFDFAPSPHDLYGYDAGRDATVYDFANAPDLVLPGAGGTCDASMPSQLWLAGTANANALYVARYTPSSGWATVSVVNAIKVAETAMTVVQGRPLLVQKRLDDKVDSTWFEACLDVFPAPAQIYPEALTLARPSVVGGSSGDIVFRGSYMLDQRLYHAASTGGDGWGAPYGQSDFLTTRNPAAVRLADGLHVIYAGGSDKLYDGKVADSGNGGTATQIGNDGHKTARAPVALVDASGALHVAWANAPDLNLQWYRRTSGGSVVGPKLLCDGQPQGCYIASDHTPALALDAAGNAIVAWTGLDKKIYSARLSGTQWGSVALASGSCGNKDCDSTQPPALASGVGGAEAELVFVRDSDGKASHARLVGGNWQTAAPFSSTNLLNAPALITLP